mmetsp:Transcript_4692/g.15673  ORF Transcript_4692/g.15673 Transcript_4692/m.15673 type:complete len:217 (+) Transcript_4692:39-689(+)
MYLSCACACVYQCVLGLLRQARLPGGFVENGTVRLRVGFLELRPSAVELRGISRVQVVLLEFPDEVSAAHLGVPVAVERVRAALDGDQIYISGFIQRVESHEGALTAVRARHHDLLLLIREYLGHLLDEIGIHDEINVDFFALFGVVASRRVHQRDNLRARTLVRTRADGAGLATRVGHFFCRIDFSRTANIQDIKPAIVQASRLFRRRHAGVREL